MELSQRTVGRISRWFAVVCALALALAMGITASAAADPGTTIYIAEGKNDVAIHSQASMSSDSIGQLDSGTPLTVISVVGADGHNWYEVECVIGGETKTGYIRDDLVEIPESGASDFGSVGIDLLTPVDSEAEPLNIPAGFRPLMIEVKGVQVPAWADDSNEYFIFCATTPTGNMGWYLYDNISKGYVRYDNFMGSDAASSSGTLFANGISQTAFMVAILSCIVQGLIL